MYKLFTSLFLVLSMNGCVTDSAAIDYNNSDAEADALAALENRDFRFMALALRGTVIPGVDPAKALHYELRCGIKLMPGITDAIRGKKQLEKMKKAHDYASKYNAVIKTRCKTPD